MRNEHWTLSHEEHNKKFLRVEIFRSLCLTHESFISHQAKRILPRIIKPCANGRNTVGQQLPTFLDVTSLLHVGECSCELLPKVRNSSNVWANNSKHLFCSATMLDLFAQLFQHCWGHARALHMVSKVLWVISFRSQHCWELLPPFARSLTSLVMVKIYWLMESRKFTIFSLSIIHLVIRTPRNPILHNHCFYFFEGVTYSHTLEKLKTVLCIFFRGGGGGGGKVNYGQFENGEYVSKKSWLTRGKPLG